MHYGVSSAPAPCWRTRAIAKTTRCEAVILQGIQTLIAPDADRGKELSPGAAAASSQYRREKLPETVLDSSGAYLAYPSS